MSNTHTATEVILFKISLQLLRECYLKELIVLLSLFVHHSQLTHYPHPFSCSS